ncbi:MAG: hypothetical protein SGILL_001683 [Bacillariaceae sp.]
MSYSGNELLGNSYNNNSTHGSGMKNSSSSHFRSGSSSSLRRHVSTLVPHRGSLCRVDASQGSETMYTLEILLNKSETTHELVFLRKDFEFAVRLFSIMDTESRGQVTKATAQEFVTLRCPVFWRRDEDLEQQNVIKESDSPATSPTFEEVWSAVASCSVSARALDLNELPLVELGVEGWMVFCRFIALAQYLEAKRRFSGRHLQQTMRHRNAPRGSEMVVVDVPPAAPPVPLTARELAVYEQENQKCLPLPELDLDHSLLAAHDVLRRRRRKSKKTDESLNAGHVKIDLFGPASMPPGSHQHSLDFCLTYFKGSDSSGRMMDSTTVRRSINDLKWLNETFVAQKRLGGTLCGRILPPFPGDRILVAQRDDSSIGSATGMRIVAAANAGVGIANAGVGMASAGVGMLKEGFKSLWSGYSPSPQLASAPTHEKPPSKKALTSQKNTVQIYYNPNSPAGKARHLERYLNYLLEHPALSTSFPLNTILKASQSGLEAAKQSLDEYMKTSKAIKEQTPHLDDGKTSSFWSGAGSMQPNLTWVRTAAQAAVALQLHGVLETTGMQSASARLQHASLPNFNNARNAAWADDDGDSVERKDSDDSQANALEESFEEGVMHVEDELDPSTDPFAEEEDGNGYDLLPLPVPAPERQVLNVGDSKKGSSVRKETRFRYGAPAMGGGLLANNPEDEKRVYLGELAIDEDIDKLRDVIGNVDNTLSRCLASGSGIERARKERESLHLSILRGLDSWEGLRGKFVSQRALLKGVSGIEQSREVFEESDLALVDDISWQTALAHSAVSAAEDVRSTVRAARTATNARTAAASAAEDAQAACEKGKFANIDEARAAQTRASISQSHAIHAAVVEHEAKTVKRRATLALAHDVKCWNIHRKREVLQIALSHAKSQHEATRRAVDAWSCLRDGYVGSNIFPSTQTRRPSSQARKPKVEVPREETEVRATIFPAADGDDGTPQTIVAVEHELLQVPAESPSESSEPPKGEILSAAADPDTILPLVVADPIPEGDESIANSRNLDPFGFGSSAVHSHVASVSSSNTGSPIIPAKAVASIHSTSNEGEDEDEAMTSSMQSLVNGLMTWGGEDVEVDFNLPAGIAASIALEQSGVFGSSGTKIA